MSFNYDRPLHMRKTEPFPSGRRYWVWYPRPNGRHCTAPGCGGPILSPRQDAAYCSDPVCKSIRQRGNQRRRRVGIPSKGSR